MPCKQLEETDPGKVVIHIDPEQRARVGIKLSMEGRTIADALRAVIDYVDGNDGHLPPDLENFARHSAKMPVSSAIAASERVFHSLEDLRTPIVD